LRTAVIRARVLLATAVLAAPSLAVSLLAQGAPPTRGDLVPKFAEDIDAAAAAAGLRPLRAERVPRGRRELRVWVGFGLGIPMSLYRIRADGQTVAGELVLWWDHSGEWPPEDNPEGMHAWVARAFACGAIGRRGDAEACRPRTLLPAPDWRALLAELDSLGIATLRTRPTRGTPLLVPNDGFGVVIEVRDGARYRTAYFHNPHSSVGGDAGRAAVVLASLRGVRQAAYRDSTTRGP